MKHWVLLVAVIGLVACSKLNNERSRRAVSNQLKEGGKNVCIFKETRTDYYEKDTVISVVEEDEVCCKEFFRCWKRCKRPFVYTKNARKVLSRLVHYNTLHCCDGWTVLDSKADECRKAICRPPCQNEGVCTGPDKCDCDGTGYNGQLCQLDINECPTQYKCKFGCQNLPGTYYCTCPVGYLPKDPEGKDSSDCLDIDECTELNPCHCRDSRNKNCTSLCGNQDGGYNCICGSGYKLLGENMCIDINECENDLDICPHKCVNTQGWYRCDCFDGFIYDSKSVVKKCVPRDFCSLTNGGCNQICVQVFGGLVCKCHLGYYLASDGFQCIDIDECSQWNPCDQKTSVCVNLPGTYRCDCKSAYKMSKQRKNLCLDRDECKEQTSGCEHSCENTYGEYKCSCLKGYKLNTDKMTCDDVDECQSSLKCDQRCVNTIGSYKCACNPGYMLDTNKYRCYPKRCATFMEPVFGNAYCNGYVVGRTCLITCNEGFALEGPARRTCMADTKWSGKETKCIPKNCLVPKPPPNGRLTLPCELSFGSTCPVSCNEGYILRGHEFIKCGFVYNRLKWDRRKTHCKEILVCKPNPCQHRGTCSIVTATEYHCNCEGTGRVGKDCELLDIKLPSIPRMPINKISKRLHMRAQPQHDVLVNVLSATDVNEFQPDSLTITRISNEASFEIGSSVPGLRWVSYKITTLDVYQSIPPSLVFFYDSGNNQGVSSVLTLNYNCYQLDYFSEQSKKVTFASTAFWSHRPGGLASTNGVVVVFVNKIKFPVTLAKVSLVKLLYTFKGAGEFDTVLPSSDACNENFLSDSQLQYAVKNDLFAKDFISQFNQLLPSWMQLSMDATMKYIHENNIRAYVLPGEKLKYHPKCKGAAIVESSLFLVYLHQEKLSVTINGRKVTLESGEPFCLIVDLYYNEPHIVMPPEHHENLKAMFPFETPHSLGWVLLVKNVGFRSLFASDKRKCKTSDAKQVIFGSAQFNYASTSTKTPIGGKVEGTLVYNFNENTSSSTDIDSSSQCFDGESRFDTPAWYTADMIRKRYTKRTPAHNIIRTKSEELPHEKALLTVSQGEKALFQLKSGLRPIIVKSGDELNVDFMYLKEKGTTSSEDELYEKILLLEEIAPTVQGIEDLVYMYPGFSSFEGTVREWNENLNNDLSNLWGDPSHVVSKIQHHYDKAVALVQSLDSTLAGLPADSNAFIDMEAEIILMKSQLDDLKKHTVSKKPKKKFQNVALRFLANVCWIKPCAEHVQTSLHPVTHDIGLAGRCYDPTKASYAVWQVKGEIRKQQTMGKLVRLEVGDNIHFCLSKDGADKTTLDASINVLGAWIKNNWVVSAKNINIPARRMTPFNAYEFVVDCMLDLELKSWNQATVKCNGYSLPTSKFISSVQEALNVYTRTEYWRLNNRTADLDRSITWLKGNVSFYEVQLKTAELLSKGAVQRLREVEEIAKKTEETYQQHLRSYNTKSKELRIKIEDRLSCQLSMCPKSCVKKKRCKACYEPRVMVVEGKDCRTVLRKREYGFLKSEKRVCSHAVKDRLLKYTGNCKNAGADPAHVKGIVEKIQKKIERNETLTLADGYLLQTVNPEKGKEMIEKIEEAMFFENFDYRLKNGLLREEEFKKLEGYRGKEVVEKVRAMMKKMDDARVVNQIIEKINNSIELTEEDYLALKKVDPELEKKIRKTQLIAEMNRSIRLTGNFSQETFDKLKEMDPEYVRNLTNLMKEQERSKEVMRDIQLKMSNGTLDGDDLKRLEMVNPAAGAKLREALKDQLKQKVSEMENKLNTVKGAIDQGFNNSDFNDLQNQLNTLTGSLQVYDKKKLEKLQADILASNTTSGSLYEEVAERMSLNLDVLNITGKSRDFDRVVQQFFGVLTQFDIENILKRSALGVFEGLQDVQDWFLNAARLIKQVCQNCGENCDKANSIQSLLKETNKQMKLMATQLCAKSSYVKNTAALKDICKIIYQVKSYSAQYQTKTVKQCQEINIKVIDPFQRITAKWKEARVAMETISTGQWKNNAATVEVVKQYEDFVSCIRQSYAAELGSVKMSFLTKDEIFTEVETYLTDRNSSFSLAQIQVVRGVVNTIAAAVEILPNNIKQNQVSTISVSNSQSSLCSTRYVKIANSVTRSLTNLCANKVTNPHGRMLALPDIIMFTKNSLVSMMGATNLGDLFPPVQQYTLLLKQILEIIDDELGYLLPCKLREENVESEHIYVESPGLVQLKRFLTETRVLDQKSVSALAAEIDDLLGEMKQGVSSPVGKLTDLMYSFLEESPHFHLPFMLCLTPSTSKLVLNSFQKYLESAVKFFVGLSEMLQKCADCKPQDIVSKNVLKDLSKRLDEVLAVLNENSTFFLQELKFKPEGLALLVAGVDQIRTALQTIWRTETGFNKQGIKNVIAATEGTIKGVSAVRNVARTSYEMLAGILNPGIKDYVNALEEVADICKKLHKESAGKFSVMKELYEEIETTVDEQKELPANKDIKNDALVARLKVVQGASVLIEKITDQFSYMYSLGLDSNLENYIDTQYAPNMAIKLNSVKESSNRILKETNDIAKNIGVDIGELDFTLTNQLNIQQLIESMTSSSGSRKNRLADSLLHSTKQVTVFMDTTSKQIEAVVTNVVGEVTKYENDLERLTQKLSKYGDMYTEVEETLKDIRDKPLSKIGEIKNAADELVDSLKLYDVNKLLAASPDVVPRKVKEMEELFRNAGTAFKEIDTMLRKCKTCQVEKIFGFNYLASLSRTLAYTFDTVFDKLNAFAKIIGDTTGEIQEVQNAALNIKNKFKSIADNGNFGVNTLSEISEALLESITEVRRIEKSTEGVAKILFKEDIDLQVISGKVTNILNQVEQVVNKSHEVAVKGKRVHEKVKLLEKQFLEDIAERASGVNEGPLLCRIMLAKNLAANSKALFKEVPSLFGLSEEVLMAAGLDGQWTTTFGENILSLTDSISGVIEKTEKVLNASDIAVSGYERVKGKIPQVKKTLSALSEAPWNKKILAAQNVTANLEKIFDAAIDTTIQTAAAVDIALTRNDLKGAAETVIGKLRLAKYKALYNNVTGTLVKLQAGPIASVGVLTDSVENYVDALENYNFGKMFMSNPSSVRAKVTEFQQLTQMAGSVLKSTMEVTGLCKTCDAGSIFGNGFIKNVTGRLETKFETISQNISDLFERVDTGLSGWEQIVKTSQKISGHFKGLKDSPLTRGTFDRTATALLTSVEDLNSFTNGSAIIFSAIFNGDNDMEKFQSNFAELIGQVGSVLNKSSIVLPKVGKVYESLQQTSSIFSEIENDVNNFSEGPLETRVTVLRKVLAGVNSISKSLPVVLNQSDAVLRELNIDSSWFKGLAGSMSNVTRSISSVINKTDVVLEGVGLVVVQGKEIHDIAVSIESDYEELIRAPWKNKFEILTGTLAKVDKILTSSNNIASVVDDTIKNAGGMDLDISGSLGSLTKNASGMISQLSTAVKKTGSIYEDISKTITDIKSGPLEKIGKLADSTEDFINALDNYELSEILILSPKFAKEKLKDLKDIFQSSGNILSNINSMVKKQCNSSMCDIDNVFGKGFVNRTSGAVVSKLSNITAKVEVVLDNIEDGATSVANIITSVADIKEKVSGLKGLSLDKEGLDAVADVLLLSSDNIDKIYNESQNVFQLLVNDSKDISFLKVESDAFVKKMSGILRIVGNYTADVSKSFGELDKLKGIFDEVKDDFYNLKDGPLQYRIETARRIIDGVNAIMTGFPDIIKNSAVAPTFIKSIGESLENITTKISNVLNKTSSIAEGVGETIELVYDIHGTATSIGADFQKLTSTGSIGDKIVVANNIVEQMRKLTSQVNVATKNASDLIHRATGLVLLKTNLFGDPTENILNKMTSGLSAVAERYEKFTNLSRSIKDAFDAIEDDPVRFALEVLPNLFNQTSGFIDLILNDVKDIAAHVGVNLDKLNIGSKLVKSAKTFMQFTQTTLSAVNNGMSLVSSFKDLLNSNNFREAMLNFNNVLQSGTSFITSIDKLGSELFEKWDTIKGSFSKTLNSIGGSLGLNLKNMGGMLEKGLSIGGDVLSIAANIEQLLNMKEFNAETLVVAANSVVKIANAGVNILKEFGVNIGINGMETLSNALGIVTAVVQLYQGIKGFISWIEDACDITYEMNEIEKELSYNCLVPNVWKETVYFSEEVCQAKNVTVINSFGLAKKCCQPPECVFLPSLDCLERNEACATVRKNELNAMQAKNSTDYNELKDAFTNVEVYFKMSACSWHDVSISKQNVSQKETNFTAFKVLLQLKKMQKVKAELSVGVLRKQIDLLRRVTHQTVSTITIKNISFEVATTGRERSKVLPIKITMADRGGMLSYLEIAFDFGRHQASLNHLAHTILANYVDYIPVKRRRRSAVSDSTEIKNDWPAICINYNEIYSAVKNLMEELGKEMSAAVDQKIVVQTPKKDGHCETQAVGLLNREIEVANSPETVSKVLTRWKSNCEEVLGSNIGTECVGYHDCFDAMFDNLTSLYDPSVHGYESAVGSIALNKDLLRSLIEDKKKSVVLSKVKSILENLDVIDKNSLFCEEHLVMRSDMPVSMATYIGKQFELECTVEGPAFTDYKWTLNGTLLSSQTSMKLQIDEVQLSDQGYYQCEGVSLTGNLTSNQVLVRVFDNIQITAQPTSKQVKYPGNGKVRFFCNGTAEPLAEYKWLFKKYSSPVVTKVGVKRILDIARVTIAQVGQYWCELSNGYHTVKSDVVQLDILRSLPRNEKARLHLFVSTSADSEKCVLPRNDDSVSVRISLVGVFKSRFGLPVVKINYLNDAMFSYRSKFSVDVGLQQTSHIETDSLSSALVVSQSREKLQSKLEEVRTKIDDELQVSWKQGCNLTVTTQQFPIQWNVEELTCPVGMASNLENLECVQCKPGTFDDGRGHCWPCPVGTYQQSAGQTKCLPCDQGKLTLIKSSPTKDDCLTFSEDYKCDLPMHVVIALHAGLSASSWSNAKAFIKDFASHMKLSAFTKLSLVTFSNAAHLNVAENSYNDQSEFVSFVDKLQRLPGAYRLDMSLELALKITGNEVSKQRQAILYVTDVGDFNAETVTEMSDRLKSTGTDVYAVVINESKKPLSPYFDVVSEPTGSNLFKFESSSQLKAWSGVISRAVCRNVF